MPKTRAARLADERSLLSIAIEINSMVAEALPRSG